MRDGFVVALLVRLEIIQIGMGDGVGRGEPDSLLVCSRGFVVSIERGVLQPEVVEGAGILRVDFDGIEEEGQRVLDSPLLCQ